ncbi:MAG: glycoside hydrolase family 108 protein [Pseudohongiellaceae bacterium]
MTFDDAFEKLIGHEGGYVNDPRDRGGETKFGISKRAFPLEDIKNLTLDRAKSVYKTHYWGPAGCDAVPPAVKFDLFDTAVNSGVGRAIRLLQRAVAETEDGILGPRTLQAVQSMPADRLRARFNAHRLLFMADAPTWPAHGRGWARRVAANLLA